MAEQDDKTMAMLAHLLTIFFTWIPGLIIWLVKKDQGGFAAEQAKEALNWGITVTIAYIVCFILVFVVIGAFLYIVVFVIALVFGIMATISANKGEAYRYPIALRLVK